MSRYKNSPACLQNNFFARFDKHLDGSNLTSLSQGFVLGRLTMVDFLVTTNMVFAGLGRVNGNLVIEFSRVSRSFNLSFDRARLSLGDSDSRYDDYAIVRTTGRRVTERHWFNGQLSSE